MHILGEALAGISFTFEVALIRSHELAATKGIFKDHQYRDDMHRELITLRRNLGLTFYFSSGLNLVLKQIFNEIEEKYISMLIDHKEPTHGKFDVYKTRRAYIIIDYIHMLT